MRAIYMIFRREFAAYLRSIMGWIVVGGLGFATIFTLYLIPVFYSLLAGFAKPRAKETEALEEELSAAAAATDTTGGKPEERPVTS